MSKCITTVLACLLLLAVDARAADPDPSPPLVYQEVPLLASGHLSVHLKVAEQASLADERWFSIVFKNSGDEPITIQQARFHTNARRTDPETGALISSGSLASANTYDLFPESWKTMPVSPRIVPANGFHIVDEHASDYSAALLRMAPPGGVDVHATIFMHLTLPGDGEAATPETGVDFQFHWRYPTEDGFNAMRQRLSRLLARAGEDRYPGAYLLGALLATPGVGDAFSCEDFIDAIVLRGGHTWDRQIIVRHISTECRDDETVINYYVQQIERHDPHTIGDLYGSSLHHPSFTEPLIGALDSSPINAIRALIVLHRHRDQWRSDPERAERVFASVSAKETLGLTPPGELADDRLPSWQTSVQRLAMTGHESLIAHFASILDDTRPMPGVSFPVDPRGRPFALRVCDVALDAVLTLLDEDPFETYTEVRLRQINHVKDTSVSERRDRVTEVRDLMIEELKERLSEMDATP